MYSPHNQNNMKRLFTLSFLFLATLGIAQTNKESGAVVINAEQLQDKTITGGAPQSVLTYAVNGESVVRLHLKPNHLYSCFGIGWQTALNQTGIEHFTVRYRVMTTNGKWSEWRSTEAEHRPEDTPTGLFWTEATFTHDATSHKDLEVEIACPLGVSAIKVDMFDGNYQAGDKSLFIPDNNPSYIAPPSNCPAFPTITTRAQWCGGSATCTQVNTAYTPTYISPTHIVIHHGASPDTYTDGKAVVQSYYNYHVNTLGWSDIGYNFLVDKAGTFFQGRHNPNLTTSDVRGAHAGNANSGSIGINFPGNLDVTIATTAQLNVVNQLVAWWFNRTGYDPTSTASMVTQAYGTQVKPRICGHRDVGQTTCPGNDLYSRLPTMRTNVKAILDACACTAPTTLTASAITSSAATLSWSGGTTAASYNIQYKTSAATTWTTTTSTTASKALSGLAANTTYQFKVQPVCSGVAGAYSNTQTFTTLVTCGTPTGLAASLISASGAKLSWTAATGAASYTVEYKTSAATTWTAVTATTTAHTLSGLAASTTYNARVKTNCSNNTSTYATAISFTTLASCGTPSGLAASSITTSGATLGWTAVSGATSYNIRYRKTGTTTWTSTTSTTNSKAITGLSHTTAYEFQVSAVCSSSSSAYTASATFTTTTPPDQLIQLGSGTQAYSGHPYATGLSDERSQYIITAADLTAAGWSATNPYLSSIAFQVSTASTQVMNSFTITVSHTTNASYSSSSYLSNSGTTATYTGNVTAVAGWNTYTFSTPFNFNNTQNLLITICWDNSTYTTHTIVPTTILSTYKALFNRSNVASGNLCSTGTGTLSYYYPNMRLNFRAVSQKPTEPADNELTMVYMEYETPNNIQDNDNAPLQVETMPAHEDAEAQWLLTQNIDFQVYPNPFDQFVNVVAEGELMDNTVKVSNLLGSVLVTTKMPNNNQVELDLSALPSGMYFITVGGKTKQLAKE